MLRKGLFLLIVGVGLGLLYPDIASAAMITPVSSVDMNLGSCTFYFINESSGTCYSNPITSHTTKNIYAGSQTYLSNMSYYGVNVGSTSPMFQAYSYDQAFTSSRSFVSRTGYNVGTNSTYDFRIRLTPTFSSISSCITSGSTGCTKSSSVSFSPYYCTTEYAPHPVTVPGNCNAMSGYSVNVTSSVNFAVPDLVEKIVNIDFGDVEVGSLASRTKSVTNKSTAGASFSYGGYDGPVSVGSPFDVQLLGSISPGSSRTITAEFVPSSVGEFSETLILAPTNNSINTLVGPLTINLTGNGFVEEEEIVEIPEDETSPGDSDVETGGQDTSEESSDADSAPEENDEQSEKLYEEQSDLSSTTDSVIPKPVYKKPVIAALELSEKTEEGVSLVSIKPVEEEKIIELTGEGTPGDTVMFMLEGSEEVYSAEVGDNGVWQYTLYNLESGNYTIYLVNDDDTSEVLGSFTYEAPVEIVEEIEETPTIPDGDEVNTDSTKDSNLVIVLGIAASFVVAGILATIWRFKNPRAKKKEEDDTSTSQQ